VLPFDLRIEEPGGNSLDVIANVSEDGRAIDIG
jgi:hypothetical protein